MSWASGRRTLILVIVIACGLAVLVALVIPVFFRLCVFLRVCAPPHTRLALPDITRYHGAYR